MSNVLSEKPLAELNAVEVATIGKRLAEAFLESRDYNILEEGWQCKQGTADLIARDGKETAFIEVKTRVQNADKTLEPEIAVTPQRIHTYTELMKAYAATHELVGEMRFDILGIMLDSNRIAHIHYLKGINLGVDED